MKSKNKFVILLMAVVFSTVFSGCQLALKEAGEEKLTDNLVGVFVTFESINLIGRESIDVEKLLTKGKQVSYEENPVRIFATKNSGGKCVFEGIEGISLFYEKVYTDLERTTVMHGDEGFTDAKVNISDKSSELSAKISYCGSENKIFFVNPVYQTSDGKIYTLPESGISGSGITKTMTETHTQTENGRKTEFKSSVSITLERVNEIEKIVVKQIGENDQVLGFTEITRDNIPDSIEVNSDTVYMIAENHNGMNEIERTLIKPEENSYTCKFVNDNGIMVGYNVNLVYNTGQEYMKEQRI
ncbi:MAG: hypothetical protein GX660_14480 [Clostridiaceae bacterium]|nr:hypothetical protein [Clostridiaceae bacterium]